MHYFIQMVILPGGKVIGAYVKNVQFSFLTVIIRPECAPPEDSMTAQKVKITSSNALRASTRNRPIIGITTGAGAANVNSFFFPTGEM